jgi:hypothetical protein
MSEQLTIHDAVSILWVNAPDAMEVVLDELEAMRESKFNAVRDARRKGVCADWITGEMLAYDEIRQNLLKPERVSQAPLQ